MTNTVEVSAARRELLNALPDDPQWCGHAMVDLSTWRCADCDRPVAPAVRRRMEAAPTAAPSGFVWVLTGGPGDAFEEDYAGGAVVGVFSDRTRIGRLLVRRHRIDAAGLRARLSRTTWYQSVYHPDAIEGWGEDADGAAVSYQLWLERIDGPGGGLRA